MTHPKAQSPVGLIAALLLLTALSCPSDAHNGAVAFAGPVDSITVDGDLSDWPEGLHQYSIARVGAGGPPDDATDFSGSFRIAHSLSRGKLYVAIEVEDQSTFVDTMNFNWDASDG